MDFDVLLDDSLVALGLADGIEAAANKCLVSALNDFENGAWRYAKFLNFIWNNVAETALSHRERQALEGQPKSLLTAAAKNLRLMDVKVDVKAIGVGSELAEIVLYGLMRQKFGALPVVPKIFHKQNVSDNAKGADSVHIVVAADGDFSVWFGEAKFYNNIEDARLGKVVKSVRNSLDSEKLKKENAIIVNLPELDDLEIPPETVRKIRKALANKNSIDSIKPRINIPILLLHECELTAGATELTPEYLDSIREYHKERATAYFKKQAPKLKDVFKYDEVKFHLILFPVPQKQPIVDTFVATTTFYKG